MDINLILLTGNLGGNVEVKTSGSTTYARFSLGSNYRVRAKDGEGYEDRCNWTRVTAFGNLAKALGRLGKGSSVLVQGRLQQTVYEKDGVRLQHSEVIAKSVRFLVVKPPEGTDEVEPELPDGDFDPGDDDIPF
jgi:single-strand DNA-binding protein